MKFTQNDGSENDSKATALGNLSLSRGPSQADPHGPARLGLGGPASAGLWPQSQAVHNTSWYKHWPIYLWVGQLCSASAGRSLLQIADCIPEICLHPREPYTIHSHQHFEQLRDHSIALVQRQISGSRGKMTKAKYWHVTVGKLISSECM